jgi:hypothetical protein
MKLWRLLLLLPLSLGAAGWAQPAKPNPNADADGQALVADLLSKRPAPEFKTNQCFLSIRPPKNQGPRQLIPVRYRELVTEHSWTSIYETAPTNRQPVFRLILIRKPDAANEYRLAEAPDAAGLDAAEKPLSGSGTMVPFAGSDFWIADLGLEFLHWPTQRLLKKEMTRGQFCNVLESLAPAAQTNGYVRVKSWLDIDTGGVVYAEAYDAGGKLLKEFSPKGLKKVQGGWELEEVEIVNRPTGSRTRLHFDLDEK